jgi:hypothetical protein
MNSESIEGLTDSTSAPVSTGTSTTNMAYGVSFRFARGWMGDYQAGYMPPPPDFPVARAVAASACFPA